MQKLMFSIWWRLVLCLATLIAGPSFAAQPYPARPIRIIVPFAPGGGTDVIARSVAQHLSRALGGSVVVENRAGAGGTIGSNAAAKAAPDGYTLLIATNATFALAPGLYTQLNYDPARDFVPIALVATGPSILVVNPQLPVTSSATFVAYAKANPDKLNYGSAGNATPAHLGGAMLDALAGISSNHIPYKGAAPMVQDLLGGQIPVGMVPIGDAVQHARSGKLRVLATTGAQRSRFLPDTPTTREAGFPDVVAEDYFALFVPSKTPADMVEKLGAALREALKNNEVRDRMAQVGVDLKSTTPAEMADIIKSQFASWAPVVKASGFSAEE